MTPNSSQKAIQASDVKKIQGLMQGLIGQMCWRAHLSYGDELRLEVGERKPYLQTAMAGQEKGSWMLGVRESDWILSSHNKTLITAHDSPEQIKQRIKEFEGRKIVAFQIEDPDLGLTIELENGLKLQIIPPKASNSKLAYWELFTPDSMVLKIGPDANWSYIPSDLPESD